MKLGIGLWGKIDIYLKRYFRMRIIIQIPYLRACIFISINNIQLIYSNALFISAFIRNVAVG